MTHSLCQRPTPVALPRPAGRVALPLLEPPRAHPLAALTGSRSPAAVRMLRIAVTDVCNLRCLYCMPREGVAWLPRSAVLTFEEITSVVRAAASAGITHFKLTGGEPAARRDLPVLVEMLRQIEGVEDLSMTSNGTLLGGQAGGATLLRKLHAAGLKRITLSLDSLQPQRFARITRGDDFTKAWSALHQALDMGFEKVKLNVVAMKGLNEDELADFAALTLEWPITVRFIEFMPLGRSALTGDPAAATLTEARIRAAIEASHGTLVPIRRESEAGAGPAKVWSLPGAAGRLGFISAMSRGGFETDPARSVDGFEPPRRQDTRAWKRRSPRRRTTPAGGIFVVRDDEAGNALRPWQQGDEPHRRVRGRPPPIFAVRAPRLIC